MVSVRALYDGHHLKLLEIVDVKTPQEVIVLFLNLDAASPQDDIQSAEIAYMVQDSGGLDFLHDGAEDIYTDEDLKKRY